MVLVEFKKPRRKKSPEKIEEERIYKEWADSIKKGDSYSCFICEAHESLNSHHIVPREHKEFLLEYDNGITLCTKHHKFSRVISAHNNPLAFFLILQKYRPKQYEKAVERTKKILLDNEGIVL